MYIENIKIGNFGKLSHRELDLTSGINIIEGRNESGKTTLCEFIKFVFYGLSNKATDGEMSERKRHISWNTNDASGSLVLNTEKGRYRIERSMVPHGAGYKDNITVVDLSNNSVVSGIKNPGEYFFGIPEEVFVRTVYIRQAEGAYFNGESIGQAVENIFYSADESVNTDKALKKLDEARVMIKHKKNTGRGLLDQLEKEKDELTLRLADARYANEQILQNENSLRIAVQSIEKNKQECEKMSKKLRLAELTKIIDKFDEKRRYEDNIEKLTAGKEDIVKKVTYEGFFPDSEYYARVDNAKTELNYLKKDVDKFEQESGFVSEHSYSKDIAKKIREYGGKNGIKELLAGFRSKKKTAVLWMAVFGVLALICIPFGVILHPIVYVGTALFAVLSIVFGAVSVKMNLNIKGVLSDFSSDNEQALFEIVSKTEEYEKDEIRNNELLLYKEQNKKIAYQKLDEYIADVISLLAEWGVVPETRDFLSIMSSVDGVLSDITEIKSGIEKYDNEIEKCRAVLSVISAQTDGFDEKLLREEYDSIDEDVDLTKIDEVRKKYDFCSKAKDALNEKVNELERTLASLKARTDRPSDIESRLKMVKDRISELTHKHDAYVLAYEKLQEAGYSLRGKLAPGLSASAGRFMSSVTGGKYSEIGVSDSLKMTYSFEENGTDYTKEIENLSSGTKDVAYVSLRLALAELFCITGERLPVVFDEAFSRVDDDRLKNMLLIAGKYSENNAQSLILTSHSREGEMMSVSENGGNYSYIRL